MSNTVLPPFTWSAQALAILRAMRGQATYRQIAAAIGTTKGAVAGKMQRLGLPVMHPHKVHHGKRPGSGGRSKWH